MIDKIINKRYVFFVAVFFISVCCTNTNVCKNVRGSVDQKTFERIIDPYKNSFPNPYFAQFVVSTLKWFKENPGKTIDVISETHSIDILGYCSEPDLEFMKNISGDILDDISRKIVKQYCPEVSEDAKKVCQALQKVLLVYYLKCDDFEDQLIQMSEASGSGLKAKLEYSKDFREAWSEMLKLGKEGATTEGIVAEGLATGDGILEKLVTGLQDMLIEHLGELVYAKGYRIFKVDSAYATGTDTTDANTIGEDTISEGNIGGNTIGKEVVCDDRGCCSSVLRLVSCLKNTVLSLAKSFSCCCRSNLQSNDDFLLYHKDKLDDIPYKSFNYYDEMSTFKSWLQEKLILIDLSEKIYDYELGMVSPKTQAMEMLFYDKVVKLEKGLLLAGDIKDFVVSIKDKPILQEYGISYKLRAGYLLQTPNVKVSKIDYMDLYKMYFYTEKNEGEFLINYTSAFKKGFLYTGANDIEALRLRIINLKDLVGISFTRKVSEYLPKKNYL